MASLPMLQPSAAPMSGAPAGGPLSVQQGFGTQQAQLSVVDTQAGAVAAQMKAEVEARYTMAMYRPRNWDEVRVRLLSECRRPAFAHNTSAYYKKPIGQGVEGLGIRFVEVALRCMSNVLTQTRTIYEDDQKEIIKVIVTDLESNTTYDLDIRVGKTVERSKPADDGSYVSVRVNSSGRKTYTVPATDEDLLNKRAALISKAIRTLGLRIIPGDLQDEAEEIIKAVRKDRAAQDPEAERKRIVDAFADLRVPPAQLAEYLGHDIAQSSPAELVDLRNVYSALKEGDATWAAVLENRREQRAQEAAAKKPAVAVAPPAAAAPAQAPAPAPARTNRGKPPTFAEVQSMIMDATTLKHLDEAANVVASVERVEDRDELEQMLAAQRAIIESR